MGGSLVECVGLWWCCRVSLVVCDGRTVRGDLRQEVLMKGLLGVNQIMMQSYEKQNINVTT